MYSKSEEKKVMNKQTNRPEDGPSTLNMLCNVRLVIKMQ